MTAFLHTILKTLKQESNIQLCLALEFLQCFGADEELMTDSV